METYESFVKPGNSSAGTQLSRKLYGTAEPGNYTGLQGEYAYFKNHRQNSATDPLIAVVHPNETGRDSDEANKPWLVPPETDTNSENGPSAGREWLQMQKLGYKL